MRDGLLENVKYYFLANPKMIIVSTTAENSNKYERMEFYDPLFSSDSIRKSSINPIIIEFKLDVNDDFSRFDREYQLKEPGFMKLRYSDECYEWRKCKIKFSSNENITAKLSSDSIRNKCKIFFEIIIYEIIYYNFLYILGEFKIGPFDAYKI